MSKKSIDWLVNPDGTPGITINYAVGCKRKCVYGYCWRYARRYGMAERMAECEMKYKYGKPPWPNEIEYLQLVNNFRQFCPTFRPSVLAQKLPKKPTMIFFSMSDPEFWEQEWYEKILEKICQHMQHTFVILTKNPEVYRKYTFPHNCWLGVTIENQLQLNQLECHFSNWLEIYNTFFISIEPIQGSIKISLFIDYVLDWIQVGPETGKRKGKITPPPEWIEYFYHMKTPVFMKQSCEKILGEHGKGKCEKVEHGIGGEYGHMAYDDSEYTTMDENYIEIIRCGRCHGKKLRQEWPKGYTNG